MTKDEAISLHLQHWEKFPVFVWMEKQEFVTEIDGTVYRANNQFGLDSKLTDGGVPSPRNLYFVDTPAYEKEMNDGK